MHSILLFTSRLYLLIAVLAGVPAGTSRIVLCVAPARHLAVEAVAGRCVDNTPTGRIALESTVVCAAPDDCSKCADLPVGEQILCEADQTPQSASAQSGASTPVCAGGVIANRIGGADNVFAARVSPSRRLAPPHRTTVLRI